MMFTSDMDLDPILPLFRDERKKLSQSFVNGANLFVVIIYFDIVARKLAFPIAVNQTESDTCLSTTLQKITLSKK